MINPFYLTQEMLAEMRNTFTENPLVPSIQLQQAFTPKIYALIQQEARTLSLTRSTDPLHHSYASGSSKILTNLLNQPPFIDFIGTLLNKKVKGVSCTVFTLGWKDFTLLHDSHLEKPGYDFVVDATPLWDLSWGGSIVYVDGSGESTTIGSLPNTLLLAHRKKNVNKFIKYINHHAGKRTKTIIVGSLRF